MVLNVPLGISSVEAAPKDKITSTTGKLPTVIFVSVNGNDSNTGVSELGSKRTIQKSIDQAPKYDKTNIIVKPGVYYENIQISGKNIILKGENATINGNATKSCITILNNAIVHLTGFTITNGNTKYGGGGISNEGDTIVENCTIIGNYAENGGGLFNGVGPKKEIGSKLVLRDSIIQNNNAYCGGGLSNKGLLRIEHSVSCDNNAIFGGGGVYTYGGFVYAYNLTITRNNAIKGGGLYNNGGIVNIYNSTIKSNTATEKGGGVYYKYKVNMHYCTLENNSAVNGGGVYIKIPGKAFNCIFKDNTANKGGATFICSGYTFVSCIFDHNHANDYGGAIYSSSKKSLRVANCVFTDNIAIKGGAIALKEVLKDYYTSRFTNNKPTDIYVYNK
jgi:predicted outer membrane repeat protein